nr:integrase, catalytic region, zinc finger, CCHC-type, peptidase aspartic, catalytic [Tanacetum cinerariifolium]
TELQKDFIKKKYYDMFFKKYNTLEKHCISLEVGNQLKKEIFQRNNLFSQKSAPTFDQLFEINDLKAQSQVKDTVIMKLKERLKSLSGNVQEEKIKRELEEIKTINIELDHMLTKLVAENEHLKQTYKQLYDSIKSLRVRSKEQCNDLIKQVNIKSAENSNLNASLQEKVLVITTLKETLSKLKGKAVVTEAVTLHPIDPELLKIDVAPLAPKLRNNKTAHTDYFRHTQEVTATLREIVERVNLLSSASRSQPQGNTKKDRIQRTPSKAKKNKLEDYHRTVRPSLNKKKSVVDTKSISSVKNSKSNVNSDLKCATCNGCLFFDNHDLCVLEFINAVNARNVCPLTRIATTAIMPLREPIPIESNTDKPVVTLVYSRKSKAAKKKVPVSNPKINKSLVAKKKEPNNSWGSTSSNVPSSIIECRLSKLFSDVAPLAPKLQNNRIAHNDYLKHTQEETATLREIVENERLLNPHNTSLDYVCNYTKRIQELLIILKQTCDSDLEVAFRQHTCFIRNLDGVDLLTVLLKVPVRRIRTDNETEFDNQTLREYYEEVGISHETSVARSAQQNGVVERRNCTLIEAARTMLIYTQALLFLWAEAVAIACYTQNHSIIRLRHGKTPYELLHNKLPDLSFLYVFGALCYPTNDSETLRKLQPKADIGIFIGYTSTKKALWIYNRRTRRIVETIHVDFDELTAIASEQSSLGPALNDMTLATISLGLTVDHPAPEVIAPIANVIPPVQAESTDVEEDNHDTEVAHMGNDSLFGVPIPAVTFAQSSSTVSPHLIVQPGYQIPQHNSKWTKDHPL